MTGLRDFGRCYAAEFEGDLFAHDMPRHYSLPTYEFVL